MEGLFAPPAVGIAIRPDAIELVQLSRRLGGVSVVHAVRVPLRGWSARTAAGEGTGGSTLPQTAEENARISEALQSALASAKIKATQAALAIPPNEVLLRSFSILTVPKSELEAAVQFEARKYIPFKMSELLWDYAVAQRSGGKTTDVIFAALERAVFLRIQVWLKGAGIELALMEPQSFSLARVVRLAQQAQDDHFAAAVDIQPSAAHIAIVKQGLAYLARDINLLSGKGPGDAVPSGSEALGERLLSELRLSIDFFTREFPGAVVGKVLLFGEPSLVNAWCSQFAPQLRCPVEAGRLPLPPRQVPEAMAASTSFGAAVGAALAIGGRRGLAPINFLKRNLASATAVRAEPLGAKRSAPLAALHKPALGVVSAAAAGLLCVTWLAGSQRVASAQRQVNLAEQNRPDIGWGLTGRSQADLNPIGRLAREQIAFLHRVVDERVGVAAKLDAIVRSLPKGVWLTGLTQDDQLTPTGESQKRLTLKGACFLEDPGQEIAVIQQFEDRAKRNADFFQGFNASQLAQISVQSDPRQKYTYRTFELHYTSDRRL